MRSSKEQESSPTALWLALFTLVLASVGGGCINWTDATQNPSVVEGDAGTQVTVTSSDSGTSGNVETDGGSVLLPGEPPRVCNSQGWCFAHPSPVRTRLNALAAAEGELFAVGDDGTVATWAEDGWSGSMDASRWPLTSLCAKAKNDVWAVGTFGNVLHYGGSVWASVTGVDTQLNGIWGPPSEDKLWAVGEAGKIYTWNGSIFVPETTPVVATPVALLAVHGTGATDLWAVGQNGTLWHRDSSAWGVVASNTTKTLRSVYAATPQNAWAVGDDGTIVALSDMAWKVVASSDTTNTLRSVSGTSASDVWAAGDQGTVVHWNGSAWKRAATGIAEDLFAVVAVSDTEAWATGAHGVVLRFNGTSWVTVKPAVNLSPWTLNDVSATSANDAWAVGQAGTILHWDGKAWTQVLSNTSNMQRSVWAVSPTDVWSLGDDTFHYDGIAWTTAEAGSGVGNAIYAAANGDVWVVGEAGKIMRRTATTAWAPVTSDTMSTLNDVFGLSASDIWVVGNNGTILHWNGHALEPSTSGTTEALTGVWAASANDAWAVGASVALHWNGAVWEPRTPTGSLTLKAVSGTGPNDVIAIGNWESGLGYDAALFRWNGTSWSAQYNGRIGTFNGVTAVPGGPAWVVSDYALILERPE